jgi:hypothetical protein
VNRIAFSSAARVRPMLLHRRQHHRQRRRHGKKTEQPRTNVCGFFLVTVFSAQRQRQQPLQRRQPRRQHHRQHHRQRLVSRVSEKLDHCNSNGCTLIGGIFAPTSRTNTRFDSNSFRIEFCHSFLYIAQTAPCSDFDVCNQCVNRSLHPSRTCM